MSERTYRVAMLFAGDPRSRATLKLEETRLGGIARALRTVSLDVEAAVYAASAPRGWLLGRCLVRQVPSGTSPCSSPKLLDGAALSADCRAHRAAGATSDMVEWPASAARRATRAAVSTRRGIPERERPRRIAG